MAIDFTRRELGPGITLYTQSTTKYKTTAVYVYMHVPLAADTVTTTAMLPMVLSRGNRTLPSTAALARQLENLYGAAVSSDIAQRGEVQSVVFKLDIANEKFIPGESGLLERGIETLSGVLLDPLVEDNGFRSAYVAQEKANLSNMIDSLINNKPAYARQRAIEAMCAGEPYSLHRYGRKADLEHITPVSLYRRYQQVLATAPVDIFVVGDLSEDLATDLVTRHLRFPVGQRQRPGTSVKREAGPLQTLSESQPINQGVLVVGLRTGSVITDPNYFPLYVAGFVLGGYTHSKLFQNVREKNSLAYYAYSYLDTTKGVGIIYAGIDFPNYQKTLDIMQEQLRELKGGHISDHEMDATIRSLVGDILAAEDRPGQMVDLTLAGLLADRPMSLQERIDAIRAVTREQVAAAAQGLQPEVIFFLTRNEGGQQ